MNGPFDVVSFPFDYDSHSHGHSSDDEGSHGHSHGKNRWHSCSLLWQNHAFYFVSQNLHFLYFTTVPESWFDLSTRVVHLAIHDHETHMKEMQKWTKNVLSHGFNDKLNFKI